MARMISLPFNYNSIEYFALIRINVTGNQKNYGVTIMNANLELAISGNDVICEKNGFLCLGICNENSRGTILKRAVALSLSKHLEKPIHVESNL